MDVTVNADSRSEPDGTFFLNLANASGAVLVNDRAQSTIHDDDMPLPTEGVVWTNASGVSVSGTA